jgi:hypothetical protein
MITGQRNYLATIVIVIIVAAIMAYDQMKFQEMVDNGCTPVVGNPSGDIWACPPGVH